MNDSTLYTFYQFFSRKFQSCLFEFLFLIFLTRNVDKF